MHNVLAIHVIEHIYFNKLHQVATEFDTDILHTHSERN